MDQTIIIRSSHVGVSCSSGIVLRNVSSACMNDSDEQLVIFRNSDGKVLKSMGPRTAKLPYRVV